jgi:hypothetical protein
LGKVAVVVPDGAEEANDVATGNQVGPAPEGHATVGILSLLERLPDRAAARPAFRGTEIVSGDLTPAQRSVQLSFGPALVLPDRSPGRLRQCVQRSSLSPLVA